VALDVQGSGELLCLIPGSEFSAELRRRAVDTMLRVEGGDESLVDRIRANRRFQEFLQQHDPEHPLRAVGEHAERRQAEEVAAEQAAAEAERPRAEILARQEAIDFADRLRATEAAEAAEAAAAATARRLAAQEQADRATVASQRARDLLQQAEQLQAQSEEQQAEASRLRAKAAATFARRQERAAKLRERGIVEVDIDTSDDEQMEEVLSKSSAVHQLEATDMQLLLVIVYRKAHVLRCKGTVSGNKRRHASFL
jgi:hypothetical protein